MSTVPMAASGIPAQITLVEVARNYAPAAGTSIPPGVTPPALPRATVPGESASWGFASGFTVFAGGFSVGPTIYNDELGDTGTVGGSATTASLSLSTGEPLGPDEVSGGWSGFSSPADMPAGSRVTQKYLVVVATLTGVGTVKWTDGAGTHQIVPGSGGPYYSAGITGDIISAIADLLSTLEGAPPSSLDVIFIGVAWYYEASSAPTDVAARGGAEEALARGIFFWSEHDSKWPSVITGQIEHFLDWLDDPVEIKLFASVQTDTARVSIQNISGNTVERDAMKIFAKTELIGALCIIRIWSGAAEEALRLFIGNVKDVDAQETSIVLDIEGLGNWSAITAPSYDIDPACPLTFGSTACGSIAPTPCDQTFGNCSQKNRFAGVIAQWLVELPDVQIAQPAPANFLNNRRAF